MQAESITLPRVMSELLEIALEDLRKCEADPAYDIYMGDWHRPKNGVCWVCMAGAAMAERLGVSPEEEVSPHKCGAYMPQLAAIDNLRTCDIFDAADDLGIERTPEMVELAETYRWYPEYGGDNFYPFYESMLSDLKAAGL